MAFTVIFILCFAASGFSLFQTRTLNAEQALEMLQGVGSYAISRMNAFDASLSSLNADSTGLDLLDPRTAGKIYFFISPTPSNGEEFKGPWDYDNRFGQLLLDNLEDYNASVTKLAETFALKKAYLPGIFSGALSKACSEIRSLMILGREFFDTVSSRVTSPAIVSQKLSAVHQDILTKGETLLLDNRRRCSSGRLTLLESSS
ncbi:hypothetical protein B0H11DRAFT_2234309 [Mycena galericulata]|nr:hypothetical protein B0H11DRAFT_2234309 [Mycena galericulata]